MNSKVLMRAARIAVYTTSGSSGKTTSAAALAAIAAERGLRVLVVDTDWQMDASRWFGTNENELPADRATLLDVLRDINRITDAIAPSGTRPGIDTDPPVPEIPRIDLLPASPLLKHAAESLAGKIGVEQLLRRALDRVEDDYDLILIDCRAGTEKPSLAGLLAADYVVGTTRAGMKELRNALSLIDLVREVVEAFGRQLDLAGILPCDVHSSGQAYRAALDDAREVFGDQVLPVVRHSVHVTEANTERLPLTARKRWSPVTGDYRAVYDELVNRGVIPAEPIKASA